MLRQENTLLKEQLRAGGGAGEGGVLEVYDLSQTTYLAVSNSWHWAGQRGGGGG